MIRKTACLLLAGFVCCAQLLAVENTDQMLKKDVEAYGSSWIYDDLAKGYAQAQASGKPMLVSIRCVPCVACRALDAQVAGRQAQELAALLEKFVCVRLIQGYGLDLDLFQYDYQLSWSVFFMNADKTLYGRYGTRSTLANLNDVSLTGFQKAAEEALKLHAQYPAVKSALAGKTGAPVRWKTPEAIPTLSSYKKGDTSRQGCIHCHKIHSAVLNSKRNNQEALTDVDLWNYPLPGVIGLTLDIEETALVSKVEAGSAADKAGFKPGDRIKSLNGQPLISIADVQWVLHNTPDSGAIDAVVLRGGTAQTLPVSLEKNWRRAGSFDKKNSAWTLGLRVLGFRSEALPDDEREKNRLAPDAMALRVFNIVPDWYKEGNHPARKSGLVKNDIILAADGRSDLKTESLLMAYAAQDKKPGELLKLTVRRNERELSIDIPIGK